MIDYTEWQRFKGQFQWRQGEHLAAIAPTGAGKTTLFRELMPYRGYSIFLGTKLDDSLYRDIIKDGFRRVDSIDEIKPWDKQVILWPKPRKTIRETRANQARVFRRALDTIANQGGWTVWVDECKYMAQQLRLGDELTFCLEQLRSINSTVICGAQRPTWLPLSVLSNSTHVFLWKSVNRDDARRLSDVGGVDAKELSEHAKRLGDHEFLYVRTRGTNTKILRSQVGK